MKPALTSGVQLNGLCLHGRHRVHSVNNACCASLFAIIFMEIEKIAYKVNDKSTASCQTR